MTIFPYFAVILFFALSQSNGSDVTERSRLVAITAASVCIVLMTAVVPFVYTGKQANIGRLFSYINNYQKPEYAELMSSIKNGRLVVPLLKGFLAEGDSPVTFGWRWQVETVNGPYNQGDPKFFKHTVHLEWEERWLDYEHTRENLMQESYAKYIFSRDSFGLPKDLNRLKPASQNDYGQILELQQDVYRAARVSPVLIDVQNPREVTEFFNILLPGGYRMVLVDIHEVNSLKENFSYVMIDDESRLPAYKNKTVFLLNDVAKFEDTRIVQEQGVVKLYLPYKMLTNKYFYHGDDANIYGWMAFDNFPGSHLTPEDLAAMNSIGISMNAYLDKLEYVPASYKSSKNRTELTTTPGFTLVKDSYFPYWETDQGQIIPTSQGFMLVYSDNISVILSYRRSLADIFAVALTIAGLATIIIIMVLVFTHRYLSHQVKGIKNARSY